MKIKYYLSLLILIISYVNFEVTCETAWGEEVHISGDSASLGEFSLSKSVEMVTNPNIYPIWKSKNPILISHALPLTYRYKYMYI